MIQPEIIYASACALTFAAPTLATAIHRRVRRVVIARGIRREIVRMDRTSMPKASSKLLEVQTFTVDFTTGKWTAYQSPTEDTQRPPAPQPPQPGRQALKMPQARDHGPFGPVSRPWSMPLPDTARGAAWSDCHRFAPGAERQRDPRAQMIGQEPPVSLICPGCELEQAPMVEDARSCPYCGLRMKLHGPRLFWWREVLEVPEWTPSAGRKA